MDHEPILIRQSLVMILILLCGILPDRIAVRAASLRDSLKSNLFNRADLERIDRGSMKSCSTRAVGLDDLGDPPAPSSF